LEVCRPPAAQPPQAPQSREIITGKAIEPAPIVEFDPSSTAEDFEAYHREAIYRQCIGQGQPAGRLLIYTEQDGLTDPEADRQQAEFLERMSRYEYEPYGY
jgi:hypothetical protein